MERQIDESDSSDRQSEEQSQSYEDDDSKSRPEFEPPEPLPPVPQRALSCSLWLVGIGILLYIIGSIEVTQQVDPAKGFAFWVCGTLMLIPGIYYSILLCKAYKAKTAIDRRNFLRDIPAFE